MTRDLGPDDTEKRMFSAVKSQEFKNAEIQQLALKMKALLSSPAKDAPLVATFTKWTFPELSTDATWREWLTSRLHDLVWIEECCALDGYEDTVPASGPMIYADTRGAAQKRQRQYEEFGGSRRSGSAAALFALIRKVTELISTLLPTDDDI